MTASCLRVAMIGLCLAACRSGDRASRDAPIAAEVTLARFQSLRWLEGSWRGTEDAGTPFAQGHRQERVYRMQRYLESRR